MWKVLSLFKGAHLFAALNADGDGPSLRSPTTPRGIWAGEIEMAEMDPFFARSKPGGIRAHDRYGNRPIPFHASRKGRGAEKDFFLIIERYMTCNVQRNEDDGRSQSTFSRVLGCKQTK